MSVVNIVIGEKYYNKDPRSSDLGGRIVSESISLMAALGFENFTFKKLAEHIASTEASIYRYFDNKLKLLLYLTTTYWAWIEYMIDIKTHHLDSDEEKLKMILQILCHLEAPPSALEVPGMDITTLRKVVVNESDKTYLTKQVDEINRQGLFKGFKRLCHKISVVITAINPNYEYPHTLSSMLLETANQQGFFAEHLPSLTEVSTKGKDSLEQQLYRFLELTVTKMLA
jgi:AcrR family transcriptional regulator